MVIAGLNALVFRSADPGLMSVLHVWFDAQLSDHGIDAMDGHMAHHPGMVQPGSK
jgi:hypothetical protein